MHASRSPAVGKGRSPDLAWSAQTWRMSAWLWLNLAAMGAATLHILIDFASDLFPLRASSRLAKQRYWCCVPTT